MSGYLIWVLGNEHLAFFISFVANLFTMSLHATGSSPIWGKQYWSACWWSGGSHQILWFALLPDWLGSEWGKWLWRAVKPKNSKENKIKHTCTSNYLFCVYIVDTWWQLVVCQEYPSFLNQKSLACFLLKKKMWSGSYIHSFLVL